MQVKSIVKLETFMNKCLKARKAIRIKVFDFLYPKFIIN